MTHRSCPIVSKKGFTLAELLIVVAILAILLIILLVNLRTQIARGDDIKRKADLAKIQKSFEEYYNDKQCYPPTAIIANCGSSDLAPYLNQVPCDPTTKKPYLYVTGTPTACDGYHLCAKLEDLSDPEIVRIGCSPQGCGWGAGYNYCVAVGSSVTAPDYVPSNGTGPEETGAGGSPTPTPIPGQWACTPAGDCDSYANPQGANCPFTYQQFGCIYNGVYQCTTVANRCKNY